MSPPPSSHSGALPGAADPLALERGLSRWSRLPEAAQGAAGTNQDTEALLHAVFGNSTYLSESLLAHPDVLLDLLERGPDQAFESRIGELDADPGQHRSRITGALRRAKRRAALHIALADLAGLWALPAITLALSRFADRAVGLALDHVLLGHDHRGEIELEDREAPGASSGVVVLGMGKLGAFELNYSSDIDLIVLFEPERLRYLGRESPIASVIRIVRAIGHLLEHRNRDGYVFRVDFRLRPHPPGHPLALSVEDAEHYYERHGQNWERAALIKARPIAGDLAAGADFLRRLEPFLWRKHLDYAAIRDIHSIKRQINTYRGHGTIAVPGHDIKVGRGGIREIEFFTQTQQLILGGRVPEIRTPATCDALRALAAHRWLEPATANEMIEAYGFLRFLEHRLQMVGDKQTHRLPERNEDLNRFAVFAGFERLEALSLEVRTRLERVERHYAALFESSLDLGGVNALVFTGSEDDPDTLQTLREMGFSRGPAMAARIRAWHHSHIRATRTPRSRELLTELMPRLLTALSEQADPDGAFERFDGFLSNLPAGVQFLSLLRANPRLLALLADIMGTAPRLAGHLSHNVGLFDALLTPDFFEPLPGCADLADELDQELARVSDLQDVLDVTRRWAQAHEFQVGLQVLLGHTDGAVSGETLTDIADVVIRALLPRVQSWLAEQHGRVGGGAFAIVGLGKLGSRELTIGSDLDLIFVYDADDGANSSGLRPLAAPTYFARLGQRLVSALTAATPEGRLYEIDTRLRPSGNVGPVACSITNFARYQLETAQIWEHQALTRARVIAGPAPLRRQVEEAIRAALLQPRDPVALAQAVGTMRARIFREHGADDPWGIKHAPGGLLEVEFLAQYVQLRFAPEHPEILSTNATETFERAAALGFVDLEEGTLLIRALRLYRRLQAVLRLSTSDHFETATMPEGLKHALVRAAMTCARVREAGIDFQTLADELVRTEQAAHEIFVRFCPEG